MKKLVILTTLTTSLLFGEVYYKNKETKNNYKSNTISEDCEYKNFYISKY